MNMVAAFLLVVGICLGSFVNAFVWRLKKKKNWVSERSICTHCKHVLAPLDLVPVLSWVFLRGKCRYCHKKIDDSPITELAVGGAFLLSYFAWPYGFDALGWTRFGIWLIALVLLAAMFLYDLKWMLLPDKLTYSLLALAGAQLVIVLLLGDMSVVGILWRAGLSTLIGGGIFQLIYTLSDGKYIGGGDVKLGYAYGLLLLNPLLPWLTLTIASVLGSIIAVFLMITGRAKMSSKLPFGPMLIIAVVVAGLWGDRIWDFVGRLWY